MKTTALLLVASSILIPACASTVGGGGGGGGSGGSGECIKNADCGADQICGFASADACNAKGQCFPAPQAICEAYSPGCACDGTVINIVCTGLPEGFVSQPLAHAGECQDGAPDAGACCPADWTMYACTFPDGSGGLACHNPALGCASSQTCGEGCDSVVTGQCQ